MRRTMKDQMEGERSPKRKKASLLTIRRGAGCSYDTPMGFLASALVVLLFCSRNWNGMEVLLSAFLTSKEDGMDGGSQAVSARCFSTEIPPMSLIASITYYAALFSRSGGLVLVGCLVDRESLTTYC